MRIAETLQLVEEGRLGGGILVIIGAARVQEAKPLVAERDEVGNVELARLGLGAKDARVLARARRV